MGRGILSDLTNAPEHIVNNRARGRSSEVERQLPKLNVEGSIPFARST